MRGAVAGAVVILAALPGAAGAVPATVPGWPVPGVTGPVLPGPGGGAVGVSNDVTIGQLVAFRPDGRVRWRSAERLGCGNCDFGPQPVRLQPDGTYGPMGAVGDDYWAVDRAGRRVAGCDGVVAADGACTASSLQLRATLDQTTVVVSQGSRWRYEEPDLAPALEDDVTPPVVGDGAGTVYVAIPAGRLISTRAAAPGRLLALDAATGALRWRVEGDFRLLSGLSAGVLVASGDAIAAYDAGVPRWTVPGGSRAHQADTYHDPARGRVYVGLHPLVDRDAWRTLAIDEATGRIAWRTGERDEAAPLSVGPRGTVYVATDRDGQPALRAITPAGRGAWQLPTNGTVLGAAEIGSGRVALTTGAADIASTLVGATTLVVDPARQAAMPRRRGFALTNTRVRGCQPEFLDASRCTALRIALPRATRLRLRVRDPRGRLVDFTATVPAPRGTSMVRLEYGRPALARGRHVLEIRAGGRVIARLPFTVL